MPPGHIDLDPAKDLPAEARHGRWLPHLGSESVGRKCRWLEEPLMNKSTLSGASPQSDPYFRQKKESELYICHQAQKVTNVQELE